ncbi:MAG: DUF4232 domain-containing protein [Frankiales bacterium]|nr:DUF4232 domain-containing protein [Frankiales bacterium]
MPRRTALLAALPLLLLTTACSGTATSTATTTVTATATTTVTATATATATVTASPSSTATVVSVTRCTVAHLTLTLGPADGTAGSIYRPIIFTNKGSSTCKLAGHPGVSFVAFGSSAQVGAAAAHSAQPPTTTVTLAPGAKASALLRTVDYGNFGASACAAVSVRGLRVYPPGSTVSVIVALPSGSKACSTMVSQLSIGAVVAGSTGQ